MNSEKKIELTLFESTAKNVIEQFGGKVGYMLGQLWIKEQPIAIRNETRFLGNVRLEFRTDSFNKCCLLINTTSSAYTLEEAEEFLRELLFAVNIIKQIDYRVKTYEEDTQ